MKIVERAADAGYPDPMSLLDRTPAEIEADLRAFAARQRRDWERLDAAAWLTGRYAAVGWHAPRRYPRRPEAIRPAMGDAEIKRLFVEMARRGGTA